MRFSFLLAIILLFGCSNTPGANGATGVPYFTKPSADVNRIRSKAKEALVFCQQQKMNTGFCILIDMSLHSGVNRLFVWDFAADTITNSFLVGHGCCSNPWSQDDSKDAPVFSNVDGSHCSSLGKYKLGERAWSDWGIHVKYLMHGLESTNSNALNRLIVFHAWNAVSDEEVYPQGTPEGWGCPTVSNNAMRIIDNRLKSTGAPVLMWIYK
ncbi:MAG TPA: murein L,D-transpeptidase catalytic domain family protein [Chitinophagales bacterium]|nr:murein L,D-transpeptidase catalytic domain family protein [Chitinophagales bacterium]